MKITVCIHLFYPDMFDDVIPYLENLKSDYKLIVNLCAGLYHAHQVKKIYNFKPDTKIIISRNRGVDIGGFLYTLKHIEKDTDLILKIHTKKGIGDNKTLSNAVKQKGMSMASKHANIWFHDLMKGVLGDETKVKKILREFEINKKCGMIGYKLFNSIGPNKKEILELLNLFKINDSVIGGNFIGGTIFWVRYEILKKYLTDSTIDKIISKMKDGYILEPSPQHAMERIFGYLVTNENKEIVVI